MTLEQKIILNLSAVSITEKSLVPPLSETDLKSADWKLIKDEAVMQTVPLTTFESVIEYKDYIPKEVYEDWESIALSVHQSNMTVQHSQFELIKLLNENNFKYQIIKGTSAAAYYQKPSSRALGDIDFLIDKNEQSKIEETLIKAGYKKDSMAHISHVIFKKPYTHLEMHFEVAGLPSGKMGETIKEFLIPSINNPINCVYDFGEFNAPDYVYHALIILLHMQHHNLNDGMGLRHLCDWAAFVNKTGDNDFWTEKFIPLVKEVGLYKYLSVVTEMCVKYLFVSKPKWLIDSDEELCAELLEDMFIGGNFGRKNNERARSGQIIAKKGEKKRSAVGTLARALHKSILLRYPIVKKVWIIYPFIFCWKVVKNLFEMAIGKKVSIGKMLPEAKKRQAIYDKLKVFEISEKEN